MFNPIKAAFNAVKTTVTAPFNIIGETIGGIFKGGFKWGSMGAMLGAVAALAAAPFTGGLSLAAIPAIAGGGALTGALVGGAAGAAIGGGGGLLHSTGESLSNLAQLNGKTGIGDEGQQSRRTRPTPRPSADPG